MQPQTTRSMEKVMRLFLFLMVSCFCHLSTGQICPTGPNCSSTQDTQYVYNMDCKNLGFQLNEIPRTCNDSRIINVLTVDPLGTSVSNIQASAFNGLHIVKLVLSQLQIKSLDSNAFLGLGNYLQVLFLDNNLLSQLPAGLFSTLTKLTTLQLHSNHLTTLWSLDSPNSGPFLPDNGTDQSSSALLGLMSLQHLTLQDNQIENISNEIFFSLSSLQDLNIERNQIRTLDSTVFSNLTSLMNLNMTSNMINFLPESLFQSNSQLQSVDLSDNEITAISQTTFSGLTNLQTLYLNDNNITALYDYIFKDLVSMLSLRLQNNQIALMESNSLAGMPLLSELYLQNNVIPELLLGVFDPVGSLTTMNLSSNLISVVEKRPFSSQSNLLVLDMSNNDVEQITSDWFLTTTNLQKLRLDENKISYINSSSFDKLISVVEINLSKNQLSEADVRGLFSKCIALQTLRLDENPIEEVVQDTFSGLTELTNLYLNSSCIRNISFDVLPYLQNLYLQHNFINSISADAFSGLTGLVTLDLSFNDISTVAGGAFSASSSTLASLNFTKNFLNESDVINLSSAQLSRTTIDLSWNQIRRLETFPSSFKGVYLAGNPFVCNCSDLHGLVDLSTFVDYDRTICSVSNQSYVVLVCYLSNQTTCNQTTTTTTRVSLPVGLCSLDNYNNNNLSAKYEDLRQTDVKRCISNTMTTPASSVNGTSPTVTYLSAVQIAVGVNVSWKVDETSDVAGFKVIWSSNHLNLSEEVHSNETNYIITHLNNSTENMTICIQILLIDTTHSGNIKCLDVSFGNGCNTSATNGTKCQPTDKKTSNNSLIPLILYIIIPIAVVVLIIIIIIIIVVVRQNQTKNQTKNTVAPPGGNRAAPDTISKASNSGMAEQSVVSVNMFDY